MKKINKYEKLMLALVYEVVHDAATDTLILKLTKPILSCETFSDVPLKVLNDFINKDSSNNSPYFKEDRFPSAFAHLLQSGIPLTDYPELKTLSHLIPSYLYQSIVTSEDIWEDLAEVNYDYDYLFEQLTQPKAKGKEAKILCELILPNYQKGLPPPIESSLEKPMCKHTLKDIQNLCEPILVRWEKSWKLALKTIKGLEESVLAELSRRQELQEILETNSSDSTKTKQKTFVETKSKDDSYIKNKVKQTYRLHGFDKLCKYYSYTGDKVFNAILRNDKKFFTQIPDTNMKISPMEFYEALKEAAELTKGIITHCSKKTMTLYRHVSLSGFLKLLEQNNVAMNSKEPYTTGDLVNIVQDLNEKRPILKDKAFLSTDQNRNQLTINNGVIITITANKGSYLGANIAKHSFWNTEQEVLLAPGQKLKIIKADLATAEDIIPTIMTPREFEDAKLVPTCIRLCAETVK